MHNENALTDCLFNEEAICMQRVKRILAAILVAMTILGCNVTGFAATKPTVKCISYPKVVKREKVAKFKFRLNVGSYSYKKNYYRAGLGITAMTATSTCWGNGVSDAEAKASLASFNKNNIIGMRKNGSWTLPWVFPKICTTGEYKVAYASFYRNKDSVSAWKINKNNIKVFPITVK